MAFNVRPPALGEWIVNLSEAAGYMFDHNIFQDNPVGVGFCEQMVRETKPFVWEKANQRNNNLAAANYQDFRIVETASEGVRLVPVTADVATCADCLGELFDPQDRRHHYPFINCTNCGPRFTIIEAVPSDRARTTMRDFEMCAQCRAEYENPLDRRFHAEPTACPPCGPHRLRRKRRGGESIHALHHAQWQPACARSPV